MENKKSVVVTICRTCMREGTNMRSVFLKRNDERCVTELLEFITDISINRDDSLPKQICNECEMFLYKADFFKRRCWDAESKLKKVFSNESEPTVTRIKREGKPERSIINADEPYQCSICLNKYAEIDLLHNHVTNFHVLKDLPLLSEITVYSNPKTDKVTLETIPEKENELIKQEFVDEIDHNSQFDDDYSDHDMKPVIKENEGKVAKDNTDILENTIDNSKSLNKLKEENHECAKCNRKFKSANSLNIHKRMHEERKVLEKKYECSLCMRKFTSKSSMTNHLRIHEKKADVKYTCGSCKREFKHKAHLDNHMVALHANEKGYSCEFCYKNFATNESLEIHKDLHKVEKKHSCQYCNKSFYMLSTLTDHIRTHTGEKPYLCSSCGRGFSQKTNLAQHMRRHLGLKPYACDHCTQRFVSKGELVAHTRKHSGAHPFICDECGNGFTTSSSLVKHRRTHSGERPYACDMCHMRFAASGTLKNHRRTHTGEKPYQCSLCEKAFVQKNDLVSHIRCHTGERPYSCEACGAAFRKPAALRSHAKMHCARASLAIAYT